MRRGIMFTGVCLLAIGLLTVFGPTFGFSTIAADRGVGVEMAENSTEALLGIDAEDDVTNTELRADSEPLPVGTLINNIDKGIVVEDVIVDSVGDETVDDEVIAVNSPAPGQTINSDEETDVTIECANDESYGEQEVVIRVVGVEGSSISIENPMFSTRVDIQCGKGQFDDVVGFTASNVSEGESTQTISFNTDGLNGEEATIDFSNPQENDGVDYSDVSDDDISIVTGGNQNDEVAFDAETSQLTYRPQTGGGGEVTIEISNLEAVGESGETYLVTYSDTTDDEDGDTFGIQ